MANFVDFIVFSQDNLPIDVTILAWTREVVTKTGSKGGKVVEAFINYEDKTYKGYAVCHPIDKFNFSYGAKMAFERALKQITDKFRLEGIEATVDEMGGFSFERVPYMSKKDVAKLWKEFLRYFPPSEKAWREEMNREWEALPLSA